MTLTPRATMVLFDAVGGLGGAVLLWVWALPLREDDLAPGLSSTAAVFLTMLLGFSFIVGSAQARLADHASARWPYAAVALGLACALPIWFMADVAVEFTRAFPVPGGGDPLDPSAAEVFGGVLFWMTFVVGALVGLIATRARPTSGRVPSVRARGRAAKWVRGTAGAGDHR